MSQFGIWSLVPPLLAIVLAIVTRQAVVSLLAGVWVGAIIFTGGAGVAQTFDWVIAAVSNSFQATILVFTLFLGSGVAFIWRLGGAHAVRDWALERLDSQKGVGLLAWGLGLVVFFDDYANTAIVGSTVKDVSDHLRVSREKLSYIVDSTAAPIATLAFSSWVAFQLSLISDGYEAAGVSNPPNSFEVFLNSIPFNMYAILAIVMVFVVVYTGRDYGEMLDAEHRSWNTGKVNRDDARPMQDVESDLGEPNAEDPRLISFFGPVAALALVTIASALYTGYEPGAGLRDMVTNADYASALVYGSFSMILTGGIIGVSLDILDLGDVVDTTIDGFGIMLNALVILVLAWTIGEAVSALETGQYVADIAVGSVDPGLLPFVVFVSAAFIAFSTGTSWGTMGILTPIAVPIAWEIAGTHGMVAAVVGTVFSGAIFGDHSSPISDTTVLSATFTGADLIDHVRTQLYYAVTVAAVAGVMLLVWGYTRVSPALLVVLGAAVLVGLVYALSELDGGRKDLDPVTVRTVRDEPDLGAEPATDGAGTVPDDAEKPSEDD